VIKHQGFNGFSYEGIAQALAIPLLSALEGAMMAGAAGPRPMHRPRL
jgi:hypothetical protein